MKSLFLCLLLIFLASTINAQVTIHGNAPTYAGAELEFKCNADPFTGKETTIGKVLVSAGGHFKLQLDIKEVIYIFSYMGIFKGHMYAEPGKTYEIAFPDKTDKTAADKLNPFFTETEFRFAIKNLNDNDLNFLTLSFDDAYSPYFAKFAGNYYSKNQKALFDSTASQLSKYTIESNNKYFNDYVYYKLVYLKHLAYQQKSKSVSREYFEHKPVLYNNTAYLELLNQVYGKYFFFFSRTLYGKKILDNVNISKSYSSLNKSLLLDSVLKNDTLREMVVMKNIHDEFFGANFSRSGLLNILDSLLVQTKIEKHRLYAQNIRAKITKLMPGFDPPAFSLYDKDNKLVSLKDFKGSYVYLNFCTCSSYGCIKEFELLKRLTEKYKEKLAIVTISTDDSLQVMNNFVTKSMMPWTFLHYGNQPSILEEYDIRAYPTYFLIGPDGKLLLSPAQSPGENFEQYLFQNMRSKGDI